MIREKIILNNNVFIADYYNSPTDIGNNVETKFIFIRNYDIINGITNDKDIYIIEKSVYLEYIDNIIKSNNKYADNSIIYPILNNNALYYTDNYELFNGLFIDNSLYNMKNDSNNNIGEDIYLFYDKDGNEKNIKCNIIKLYKPNSISVENCIIHVSNYINGINFHYLCRLYDKYEVSSDTLFTVDNNNYCEYITILIPALDSLFDSNTYFNENLNNIISLENNKLIDDITNITNKDLIEFSILLHPYTVENYIDENGVVTDVLCKKYFNPINNNKLLNDINIYPIKMSLYLYSSINETTYLYISDIVNHSGIATFISDNKVELINNIGFNEDGKISLSSKIHYNNILVEDEDTFGVYCRYYNIKPEEYENYAVKILDIIRNEFCEEYGYNFEELLDTSTKAYRMFESFISENEENINSRINFIGYHLILTSDINGKNVLYDYYFPIQFDKEYSNTNMLKHISLFNVFENWSELPNTLYASITFIDRYIGNVIKGNKLCITKEWFKYIISDTNIYKLKTLEQKSKDMVEINLTETSSNTPLFINKINCVIKKEATEVSGYKTSNTPRVLYKPYFYKVQDLQNIYLRSALIQNIGINLNEYMTKVETFKLSIENLIYVEIGRNDAYVIFRINAAELANTGGRYDIFNQDDEYISSGQYTLY